MPQLALIYLVFFVSGAAALIYQIAWVRSLSLVFGGSHLAVTTVVSVFMGGLALGGYLVARRGHVGGNGIRRYARLEAGIALGALGFQLAMQAFPWIYPALAALAPESSAYLTVLRVILCVLVLLPITTMMGATLPVLVDFCATRRELFARRLSALYAVNTVGAVAGVGLAGFVLLPTTSISTTVTVAFCANLLAAATAWWLSRGVPAASDAEGDAVLPSVVATELAKLPFAREILFGAAISGFCALAYEVLWTRVLVLGLGATDYGFSAILIAFLIGIALGSALYNRFRARWIGGGGAANVGAVRLLALTHLLVGLLIAASLLRLYELPANYLAWQENFEHWGAGRFAARQWANLTMALVYLGLPALVMGAAFPLAGDLYGRACRSPAVAVGRLAAVNTLGAILGAALAGFVLIRLAGIERAIQLVVATNLAFAFFLVLRTTRFAARAWLAPVAVAAVAGVLLANPGWLRAWDDKFFAVYRSNRPELFASREKIAAAIANYRVLYYAEGNTSIVAATQTGPLKVFSTNGRVEATNGTQDVQNQFALGHLPTLLHREPREVLVVGGGAGMTLGATAVHPSVRRVTLAELEPKVLGVIREFGDLNHHVLESPKLKVVINDGRNHLLTTRDRYDVITSDPIHPWFRGAGYLYTREYFKLAAERLNPGGVMAQWLPLYQLDTDHIRAILASFAAAFDHVGIWLLYSDAVIVGSNTPLSYDLERIDGVFARAPAVAADLALVNMGGAPENLLSYHVAGTAAVRRLTQGARLNTDDNLYLEYDSPRAIGRLTEADNVRMLAAVREPASPMVLTGSAERRENWRRYEASRLAEQLDRIQLAAHQRLGDVPATREAAAALDGASTQIGRWRTIRAYLPGAHKP